MINISYDKETDILDIKFSNKKIIESEINEETGLIVDYDENNKIVGIEILSFSKKTSQNPELQAIAIWFCF